MIVADGLGKRFGRRTALADATFRVARGEVVGFLGPNGAGKTTALRILAGIFPPSSGRAIVGGVDVVADPHRVRAQVGYALERPALYPEMTVAGLLGFVARLRGAAPDGVRTAITRTRLEPLADRRIETLSKGMRQRVGLAAALVGDPPVLLLDEPTAGLDPRERMETRRLVRALAPSHAVLLSSHELGDVESCCDRIVVLHRGRVLAEGPPADLATRLHVVPEIRVEARGSLALLRDTIAAVPGVARVVATAGEVDLVLLHVEPAGAVDVRPAVAAAVTASGGALLGLEQVVPSLEELFLRIVSAEDATS